MKWKLFGQWAVIMGAQLVPIIVLAVVLRLTIGLFGHSGQGKPPMFGDFEAQRHWMEITTAIPMHEW